MDKVSIIQLIEELKSLDLKRTPSLEIEKKLEPLFEFHLPMVKIVKGSIVVRTRVLEKEESIFTNVGDISYRTKNVEDINRGRCNDVGESVFYSSLRTERVKPIEANTLEILPRLKNNINHIIQTVSGKWEFEKSVYIPFIGGFKGNPNLCEAGKNRFNFLDEFYNNSNNNNNDYIECLKIVDEFLCCEFSKIVKEDYEYKISAIYSKMLRDRDRFGIVYPSVGSNQAGLNLVLFKASIDLGIIQCKMAIYSKFYIRNKNIGNEHLMLANIDGDILRWYEEYNHKLPPFMKRYYTGESDDDSFLKYIHFENLGV